MRDFPQAIVPVGHVEPVPRRVRATLADRVVFDSIEVNYVWEWPYFPQYYIPIGDVVGDFLHETGRKERLDQGTARVFDLRVGTKERSDAARLFAFDGWEGLTGRVRFDWPSLEHWYEEDEEVYVHPRSPYSRVDAIRSTRRVRVELNNQVLAESDSPVMVFETGLPTRYYLPPTEIDFSLLEESETRTSCPYKGRTTRYWSLWKDEQILPDVAWSYGFPTPQLAQIAGLVSFYNEKVDIFVDGRALERPKTHFSD